MVLFVLFNEHFLFDFVIVCALMTLCNTMCINLARRDKNQNGLTPKSSTSNS